jgi:hypothetical protein
MPHNLAIGIGIGFGGGVFPVEYFSLDDIVFTESMYKREDGVEPFDAAPIIQGAFNGSGSSDILSVSRGNQIYGNYYSYFDGYQGTVVKWWKPEKSRNASYTKDEYLWYVSPDYYCRYSHVDEQLEVAWGGQTHTHSLTTVAGTKYFVAVRGDCSNTLDGTNYISISVDDSHSYGATSQPTATAPDASMYFGSNGTGYPVNAILTGTTFFRRPLYDGTHPSKLSDTGDELAEMYNSGTGRCPELAARCFDIALQISTDEVGGNLETGTGNCWSFPSEDNLLTNWHLQDATSGEPDNWTVYNGAICTDGATADILFDARIQKITVDARYEGIKQSFVSVPGNGYYLAAWVKTGGTNEGINILAYDVTNAEYISYVTTDSTDYTRLEMTFEAPENCTSIEIQVESADNASYDMHVAKVLVMNNLFTNPSMEQLYIPET